MRKRFILLLSLALALSLTACKKDPAGDATGSPAVTGDPTRTYAQEFARTTAGLDADTVMFTVNGEPLTAEYYLYWLAYDCYEWYSYTGGAAGFDTEVSEGKTAAEFLKEDAQRMAAFYVVLEQKAEQLDCGLTEEQLAQWEQVKEGYRQQLGEEGFALSLRQMGLSETGFDRIGALREISGMYDNLTAALTTEPTREELDRYIEENDVLRAKHILVRTVVQQDDGTIAYYRGGAPTNEDGSAYTGTAEDFNAAALEKINDILAQIGAADDPAARFDELMHLYSEDTGLVSYPDGYDFTANQMHAEFEQGVRDLEYDEYSARPVETADGYHIILRLRPEVSEQCRQAQLESIFEQWIDEMAIENVSAEYEGVDTADFYEKYSAYAETIYNEWLAQRTASPSAAPEG